MSKWTMKILAACLAAVPLLLWGASEASVAKTDLPQYSSSGQLLRPDGYRQWVWLSSGFGMAYGPAAAGTENQDPPFDNVFVTPSAYRSFLTTGKWPDRTVFVLEIRSSVQKASIDQHGHSQGDIVHMEVHVKDEKRFPRKWAFYSFASPDAKEGTPFPVTADCFTCHEKAGALDTTFAQFYPTVRDIAKQKGTLKPAEPTPAQ
jgi:hypothetical protein